MPKRKKENGENGMDSLTSLSPERPQKHVHSSSPTMSRLGQWSPCASVKVEPNLIGTGHANRFFRIYKGCVPNRSSSSTSMRSILSQSVCDRYTQVLDYEHRGDTTRKLGRCCFYEKGTDPKKRPHFDVSLTDMSSDFFKRPQPAQSAIAQSEFTNAWQKLSKKGKADLCRVLKTPVYLSSQLKFLEKEQVWVKRQFSDHYDMMVLGNYGDSDPKYSVFTDQLTAGIKTEELEPLVHLKLLEYWDYALKTDMSNGDGRTAVFALFEEIICLLPEMNIKTPVEVFHKTCPSKRDSFYVSESDSSSSKSGSCKIGKGESDARTGSCKIGKGEGDTKSRSCKIGKGVDDDDDLPKPRKRLADMVVIGQDEKSGHAKYLAVVEIRSKGKSEHEAQLKFFEELIFTLQAQESVCGFFFSASYVLFYHGVRDLTGDISFEKWYYPLTAYQELNEHENVHVATFQMLTMDILASLLYGIKKIEV